MNERVRYDPEEIIRSYTEKAEAEDQAEKGLSLRTEIPREYIKRYLKSEDNVLDAGGGVGINAIMMAGICESVTLLDITPRILELARENVGRSGMEDRIDIVRGDICQLDQFDDGRFSFVVCVGDALSYALDRREKAISELVRVAEPGSFLVLGTDSKFGFLRLRLAEGDIEDAWRILRAAETRCGMGPRTHLYTVSEMERVLEASGCRLVDVASTPSLSDTIDVAQYVETDSWEELKALELEICSEPELLGTGVHLLFVAQKG
jgi:ubiquinone/menaquinone biosynthesis C-methylase UbiE